MRGFKSEEIRLEVLPPRCPKCDGLLKGDTVAFGEPIPPDVLEHCVEHSARADLVIVAGTSATVYPAAGFAIEVKQRGGVLIEANLYESEITQDLRYQFARCDRRSAAAPCGCDWRFTQGPSFLIAAIDEENPLPGGSLTRA